MHVGGVVGLHLGDDLGGHVGIQVLQDVHGHAAFQFGQGLGGVLRGHVAQGADLLFQTQVLQMVGKVGGMDEFRLVPQLAAGLGYAYAMSFRHPVVFGDRVRHLRPVVCGLDLLLSVRVPGLCLPDGLLPQHGGIIQHLGDKKNAFLLRCCEKALKLDAPQRAIYHYVMPCLCAGLTMHTIDGTRRMFTPWSTFFSDEGRRYLRRSIELALDEDGPDLTAQGLFAADAPMHAVIRAKEDTHVVGLPVIHEVFEVMGADPHVEMLVEEASTVPAMTEVVRMEGPAIVLLKAERVILNFITHLSGIANLTARYVRELEGTGVRLLDTRKTTPCLRWPEKYAVQAGGGCNHRKNLVEMLMLKDNHIDAAGSITRAVARLRETYSPCPPIEVECRTLDHVREAVAAGADRIMMDNMGAPLLGQALELVPAHIEAEVSGGVTLETIRGIALTGPRHPDFISVGRLTHSAVAADFSMTLANA